METRVVSHACGFSGRPAVDRPRMTVLPEYFIIRFRPVHDGANHTPIHVM